MFRNNCMCVPCDVSAHITMESKERKAIQCPRPGLFTQGDLLVQDNACLHTAHTTTALLYTRYWEHVPVQPQVSPSNFQANGKQQKTISWVSNFHLTIPSEMRSRSGFESRLRKPHHMLLQAPEQAWWLCGQEKDWCPHTIMCFKSTGLQKNKETQFLTSLAVWVSVVI
jgi:hypothetical protein